MMGPPQERAPHRNCSSSCAMVGAMSLRAAAAGSHGAAADPNILNQRRSSGSRIHGAPRCLPINGGPLRAQAAGRPEGRNAASSFKNVFQPVTERKWAPSGCQIEQKLGAFAVGPLPGRRQAGTAASALSNLEAVGVSEDSEQELLYSYVVFDMDGECTQGVVRVHSRPCTHCRGGSWWHLMRQGSRGARTVHLWTVRPCHWRSCRGSSNAADHSGLQLVASVCQRKV